MAKVSGGTRAGSSSNPKGVGGGGGNSEAVEWYVSGEGMWINQYLRGKMDAGELSPYEKDMLNKLDSATSKELGKEQTLYRSVDASAIFGPMSDMQYVNLQSYVVYGNNQKIIASDAQQTLAKAQGTRTDNGFMSTTKDESLASDWRDFTGSEHPIVLKMQTSKTTKGRDLTRSDKALNERMGQSEVLLGKGQRYKIGKVYGKNGNIYVEVKLQ